MNPDNRPTVALEWRRNWTVALAAAMGYSAAGLQGYGFGPFVVPLEQEFGWSRAQVMIGLTISGIFSLALSILVGMAIDRLGARRIGMMGLTLKCGGFALLATATGSLLNWSLLWAVVSLGVILVQANVWTSAIAARFDKGRGFAMAVALAGSSLTAALAPVIASLLMADHGWRFAMAGIGAIWFAVAFPLVFLLFRGRGTSGTVAAPAASAGSPAAELPGLTMREAIRLRAFWFIAGGNFVFTFYTMALAPNLVPLLGEKGASLQAAAQIASLVGIVSLIARLTGGFLLDRFPPNVVATVIFLLPVAGCGLMLIDSPSYLILAVAVASFGATIGAEHDVIFYMTSRHMGLKSFGALLGAILTASSVAAIIAPVVVGWIHDRTGSYDTVLVILMALMAVASLGMAFMGKPRHDWSLPAGPGEADGVAR